MPRQNTIQLRKGTLAQWTSNNTEILASGEPGFETDTLRLKIGNGTTAWSALNYVGLAGTGTSGYLPKFNSSQGVTNSLIFDNGTNVGIGTGVQATTPPEKLTVDGNIRVADTAVTQGKVIQFTRGGGDQYDYTIGRYGLALAISVANDAQTHRPFQVGYHSGVTFLPKFHINGYTGDVGIGTSTPSGQLHVIGTGIFSNNIIASGFIKSEGTSSQFLKANGTVDSTAYTTNVGTVTSVASLTLGTTGTDVTSTVVSGTTTPVITLNIPTASASNRGALSSADWTTFNNKQATITGGASTIASSNLTTNRALVSDGSGKVAVSDITNTELNYLDNVTSNVQTQINTKIAYGEYSQSNPVFGQKGIKHNIVDNVLYSAADRFEFYIDNALQSSNSLFNLNYDQVAVTFLPNVTKIFRLVFNTKNNSAVGITYPQGSVYFSFYYTAIPASVSGRIKDKDGVWYNITNWTNVAINAPSFAVWRGTVPGNNYIVEMELTVVGGSVAIIGADATWLSQIEYVMDRPGEFELGVLNKAQDATLWRNINFKNNSNTTTLSLTSAGNINLTSSTASCILSTDGSKNITALNTVTYPSLTELSHVKGATSSIQTALDLKSPLSSPTFTGTPAAPTAPSGTNTTQIATTAFVRTEISSLVDAAPGTLDTLNELAAALGDDPNFATTVTNSIGTKQATITGGASTITSSNLTINRALISDSNGKVAVSDITNTELNYLDNASSNIQTQLNSKTGGTGTNGKLSKWSSTSTLNDSILSESSTVINIAGSFNSTIDDSYLSFDANARRIGITKKGGFTGKFTYGSTSLFAIAQSSSSTIEAANTFTDRLVIDSSGNVGIGTTTPGSKLEVNGEIAAGGASAFTFAGNAWGYDKIIFRKDVNNKITSDASGNYNWLVAGRNWTLSDVGNVGIGTASPSYKLDVAGDAEFGSNNWLKLIDTGGNNGRLVFSNIGSIDSASTFLFRNNAGTTEHMRITTDGKIGIGVSSPQAFLDIKETLLLTTAGKSKAAFFNFSGNYANILTDPIVIGTNDTTYRPIAINYYQNTPGIVISSSGNVGIGTTVPDAKLVVSSSTDANSILWERGGASGTVFGHYFRSTANNTTTFKKAGIVFENGTDGYSNGKLHILNRGGIDDTNATVANAARITVLSNGNIGIGTTTPGVKLHVVGTHWNDGNIQVVGTQRKITLGNDQGIEDPGSLDLIIRTGNGEKIRILDTSGNVGIGTTTPTYKLEVNGSFAASTKSFRINHPSKKDHSLEYGSLESPYHGVRLTGRGKVIKGVGVVSLPDYLKDLIHDDDTLNIQITNIKHGKTIYVDEIDLNNDQFTVRVDRAKSLGDLEFFWVFTGVRKDVDHLVVEREK